MPSLHFVLLPFMSKGHTIPILHIAHHLLHQGFSLTIFTTPSNSPFIHHSLAGDTTGIITELPFPTVDGIPAGIESTDQLPSIQLFLPFIQATKNLQQPFERALNSLLQSQPTTIIISDAFLPWTQQSAVKFNVPRLYFMGTGAFSVTVTEAAVTHVSWEKVNSDDQPFSIPCLPSLQLTKSDIGKQFTHPESIYLAFNMEVMKSSSESWGFLVNSFYELESTYVDYWNREFQPKAWCVGPLCLMVEAGQSGSKSSQWLDEKLKKGRSVLYVAFGSQAEISEEQLCEIALGLEKSEQDFLWVVRKKEWDLPHGFEERVGERGLVVREWVEQQQILGHECVRGFLSHCGWNSFLESECAGVPVLAWPMLAEQPLNARLVEELGVGIRMPKTASGCVGWECVKEMVMELMVGEKGRKARERVEELRFVAKGAVAEGGSSWNSWNQLINELGTSQNCVTHC